ARGSSLAGSNRHIDRVLIEPISVIDESRFVRADVCSQIALFLDRKNFDFPLQQKGIPRLFSPVAERKVVCAQLRDLIHSGSDRINFCGDVIWPNGAREQLTLE